MERLGMHPQLRRCGACLGCHRRCSGSSGCRRLRRIAATAALLCALLILVVFRVGARTVVVDVVVSAGTFLLSRIACLGARHLGAHLGARRLPARCLAARRRSSAGSGICVAGSVSA
eukprot:364733-Chlamydomonas_euryale.AAC.9